VVGRFIQPCQALPTILRRSNLSQRVVDRARGQRLEVAAVQSWKSFAIGSVDPLTGRLRPHDQNPIQVQSDLQHHANHVQRRTDAVPCAGGSKHEELLVMAAAWVLFLPDRVLRCQAPIHLPTWPLRRFLHSRLRGSPCPVAGGVPMRLALLPGQAHIQNLVGR